MQVVLKGKVYPKIKTVIINVYIGDAFSVESRCWGRFLLNIWTTLSVHLDVFKPTAKPTLLPGPDLSHATAPL